MAPDLSRAVWRKSSYSGGEGGACVELACNPMINAVRDSKNPAGPVLIFSRNAVHEFLGAAQANKLHPHR